jgi:4-amino-4-deoxy-L-arabinose transferase-like glycosyltransferase
VKSLARVWWSALAIKCVLAALVPLSNDEAYYWVWGHNLQWSYFDHPPMVGWLFYLGSLFDFAAPTLNLVRWPGVILGHCTLLIWLKILAPYLDERKKRLWLIFILLSPLIGFGSIVITPDIPLLFFWSLSLYVLLRTLENPSLSLYAVLGASLGLTFTSKYQAVLFVPIALIWIFASGEWRKVRWSYVPVTLLMGLAFCFPVLYWNYKNEWASFAFQLDHGLGSQKREWSWPIEYLAGQAALVFPVVIYFALKKKENAKLRFLHYFGWLPIAFFFYTSFKAHVEANWPIMAYPALLSLAFVNAEEKTIRKISIFWAVAGAIVASEALFRWVPVDPEKLKSREYSRFDFAIDEVAKPETYLASYQMAAALSYRTQVQHFKLAGLNRKDFYDFIPASMPTGDRFRVILEPDHRIPKWVREKGYVVESTSQLGDKGYRLLEVVRNAQDTHR